MRDEWGPDRVTEEILSAAGYRGAECSGRPSPPRVELPTAETDLDEPAPEPVERPAPATRNRAVMPWQTWLPAGAAVAAMASAAVACSAADDTPTITVRPPAVTVVKTSRQPASHARVVRRQDEPRQGRRRRRELDRPPAAATPAAAPAPAATPAPSPTPPASLAPPPAPSSASNTSEFLP